MASLAPLALPESKDPGGKSGKNVPHRRFGDDGGDAPQPAFPLHRYQTGIWFALVPIAMLFTAFTSSYVVRQGLTDDWRPTVLPALVWWNSLVLVSSSVTMEIARRKVKSGSVSAPELAGSRLHMFPRVPALKRWLLITLGLGTLFLAGQLVIWRQLAAKGIYLATNPSSSFLYLLTATHGVHLLGGILGLAFLAAATWKRLTPAGGTGVGIAAVYWHFMDVLWIYVLMLLVLVP